MTTTAIRFSSPFVRLLCLILLALGVSSASLGAVFVSVGIAPPALPVYVQPVAPGPGYIWTPGYWAYGPNGYYWVPGTWVIAPYVGALWTPGYWGWGGSAYVWHGGYWGRRVGYYGGINYGFGYTGVGYYGGSWNRGVFSYNTAVTNVNVTNVHNTYNRAVVENTNVSRVSYNGGAGGINRTATSEERLAESDRHRAATSEQLQHERGASTDRGQWASVNHGAPGTATTATPRNASFKERSAGAGGGQNAGAPKHAQQGGPQGQGGQHQGQGQGRGGQKGGERQGGERQGGGERHGG